MAYDINIQIVPAARYTGQGFYSFGQTRSLGVRGIQKLINIFAKFLLTPVGTDPLDLSYGTNLTHMIGTNVVLADARELLNIAVGRAVSGVQRIQAARPTIPADERLASASVTAYLSIPSGPGFAAQILITNTAGQQLQLVLPTLEVRQ